MKTTRRAFLAASLVMLVAPRVARAQQAAKVYRIGWLSLGSPEDVPDTQREFRAALRQLGYQEGQLLIIDRWAEGRNRLPAFAAELVGLKVDVLVTESTPAAQVAKQTTASIPIVMMGPGDPVAVGLVSSLARPGGNITGVSANYREVAAKCVEVLREVVRGMSRIAFLGNAANPVNRASFETARAAANSLALAIDYVSASAPAEIERALAALSSARVEGVIVSADAIIWMRSREIIDFMARARLPAVYFVDENVRLGGLMSYGVSWREIPQRAALYVDRILKGARPADLPVEEPRKFELLINLKTAKALGLTIPPSLLLRAEQVID